MKSVPPPRATDENAGTTVIEGGVGAALASRGVIPRVAVMMIIAVDNGIDHLVFSKFFIRKQR